MKKQMAASTDRLAFNVRRFKGFLSSLRRSKRGMFGVIILVVAIVVALSAPLLTPYDPINTIHLSGNYAAPIWLKYFPGGEGLAENMRPINDPGFASSDSLKEFNVTVTPKVENLFVQHASQVGLQGNPGSLELLYESSNASVNSKVTVLISKDFYYPYSDIPGTMTFYSSILLARLEGVSVQAQIIFRQNWLVGQSSGLFTYNVSRFNFGQPPTQSAPHRLETYMPNNFTATKRLLDWIAPTPPYVYQSLGSGTLLKQLFPKAGSYTFGVMLTIKKLAPNAEAVIYLDNVDLQLQGTAYGLIGTDALGRDVFTQLIYGTRISLIVGLLAAILSVSIGLVVGLVSAYLGGIVDEVLMRFTDALLVLPGLPLMIVLMAVLSASQYNLTTLIIVIGFLGWMGFARVVRSQVLSLKERPYVEAAKAVGAGTPYILARHILPNVVTLIYVTLALSVPSAIVSEAALSFLGFKDLSVMSWGRMLTDTAQRPELWWLIIPPGLAIAALSLSFILLGYALDDILNPKLRMRR